MADNGNSNRLRVALEVTRERAIAARVASSRDFVEAIGVATVPSGALAPSLTASNVLDPPALREAIRAALLDVADRSHDVILVLPDAAVRVFLMDFDALPERQQEAASVVRFRLRKSLPFDVERAAVSYDVQRDPAGIRVIAAVALSSVVAEFESAVRAAGYNPGVVLPSSLAALGVVDASRATFVVKIDALTTSFTIVDRGQVRLFRMLEHPGGLDLERELAAEIHPSVVFFQDTYHSEIERVLIGGAAASDPVIPMIEAQTGAPVQELIPGRFLGSAATQGVPRPALAGVVGALVQ